MNTVIAHLAATDIDDFDDALLRVFAQVGQLLDVLAVGESTAKDDGVGWHDASRATEADLAGWAELLRQAPDADGPFSLAAPDGRVIVAAPASSSGFSRFTAVVLDRGVEPILDGVLALELLSSVAGAARQRVMAERRLRASVERQAFLNEVATRAAVEAPDTATLQSLLDLTRDHFGVTAVSTLVRDESDFVLVATTDFLDSQPIEVGSRTSGSLGHWLELTKAGHLVRGLTTFDRHPDALTETYGEVLCVPRYGTDDVVGMVVFTEIDGREWSPDDIDAAKSVARSLQKLTLRAETDRAHQQRRALDQLVTDVASIAASATLENLDAVILETLRMALECFEVRGAGIWATGDGENVRMLARWQDGRISRDPVSAEMSDEERDAIVAQGHGFVRLADVRSDELADRDARGLVLPIGPGPSGLIIFVDPDHWWTEEEITACRTLANLADQTRARLHADALMLSRLRDEAFTAAVAAAAVDIDLQNVDERLEEILRLGLDHFGVVEAAVWRYADGEVTRRISVRADGGEIGGGHTIGVPDLGPLASRGWAFVRLGELDLGTVERLDPPDAGVLLVSYGGFDGVAGLLVMTDPPGRWWNEHSIASARMLADTLGQLRMRMQVARRLRQQQEVDEVLAEASRTFVNTTLDDAARVVTDSLEQLRARFGLAGLTLVQLDHQRMQLDCASEVTDDGLRLIEHLFPIPRDHPVIARVLDPNCPDEWLLGDLFSTPELDAHPALVLTSVRGRDVQVLIATHRPGSSFEVGVGPALGSMVGLLAQLRRRLLLEIHSRRRAAADQLVADIARSFVDQPPYDHDAAVSDALARIAEFFGLRAIGRWVLADDLTAQRDLWWGNPDIPSGGLESVTSLPIDSPLARAIAERPANFALELGALAPRPELAGDTVVVQRLVKDAVAWGMIAAVNPRPPHLVIDLDIQRDVLASVARLMEQLRRRADADRAVARQLRHEDLLRRFATSLVDAEAESHETLSGSFFDLVRAIGVDQVTTWHLQPADHGFDVEAAELVARDHRRRERSLGFRLPKGFTDVERAPHFSESVTIWDADALPDEMAPLVRGSVPDGPRQVLFLPAPGSDPSAEASYLFLSRAGPDPFTPDEVEFFRSAHSILLQHEARVTAERWFSAAFNSAPIGITLREADMTLIHCNAAYAELVGRPIEELSGTTLRDVMPAEMASARANVFDDGYDRMRQVESAYRRPDGTVRWASVRTSPVRLPGRRDPLLLTYAEDITERRRNREMLEYQATHDELTGLPNRRALVAEIAAELDQRGTCAVLVLDLDRFKVVNDSLGHSVGDQLLITCADRIRLSLRPGDSVCRLGGDEFAILLRSPADHHTAGVVAERLLALLREPVVVGDHEVYPTASLGVATPQEGDTVEDLLRHADAAMYQSKGLGRDRWDAFDGSMRQAVADRVRTESDLRRAIDKGQIEVHYQPEFLLETGRVVGTEALVRWRHPERGLLTAGAFIGLAEETGQIADLGRWVLARATRQGARWVSEGHDIITRVNLSARQLRGAVVAEVEEALASAGLAPDRLCLELTETAIMDDVQESARILAEFRALGVKVAIDDFGTGFSSLAYLKRFPVDILKIDRTFVDGIGVDADDTAIVQSVIGLARTLRLEVVAEGIEDAAQVRELVRLGCGRGQGFHLARPGPAADVSALLAANRAIPGETLGE